MTTLTEFLLARIAEDRKDALAAIDDDATWLHTGLGAIIQGDARMTVSSGWLRMGHRYEAGDHIARHDPARVLAECEAKWKIVKAWSAVPFEDDDPYARQARETSGHVFRCLASVYADHSDYREEWRP